jgi:hypothetical protein
MKLDVRTPRDIAQAAEIIATLPAEKRWQIEVKEWRGKRTSAQNRLLWVVYTAIAKATGHTPEEVHEAMKAKFLPPRVVKIGGEEVEIPPTTTATDVPEFSEYVERVVSFAATELGVNPL